MFPMRAIFVCTPSKAYGEVNAAIPLARGIADSGGEVWFVASPLAAGLASSSFPGRVFTLTRDREFNQSLFWRVCGKFRPDLIVFVEFYEILRPSRIPGCPLIDRRWIRRIASFPAELIFMDFIAHVPMLREISDCKICSRRFDRPALQAFLQRLRVILPCPLNEPGPIEERCGIPYRTTRLPLGLDPEERRQTREKFIPGSDPEGDFLIVRTGATWQSVLAEKYRVPLYEHLSELLTYYFGQTGRRVVLVSVSSHHRLAPGSCNLKIINFENLPPPDFNRLVLSCDLLLTDNEIGYGLANTIGRVPGLVFVNSFRGHEILARERAGSVVSKVVQRLETYRSGAVYPYKIFPLPAPSDQFVEDDGDACDSRGEFVRASRLRLGRMRSSPFLRAEIYGGEETRRKLAMIVGDTVCQEWFARADASFLERLNSLPSGPRVIASAVQHPANASGHTVL